MRDIRTSPDTIRLALTLAEGFGVPMAARGVGRHAKTVHRWRAAAAAAAEGRVWPGPVEDATWARKQADAERLARRAALAARYRRARYLGEVLSLPSTGTARRLRALMALGWPARELAARLGCTAARVSALARPDRPVVFASTAARVTALYDDLSMTVGPSAITRVRGQRAGWPPPLAWDDADLDDPATAPHGPQATSDAVDVARVVRRCYGDHQVSLTRAERHAVVARLHRQGLCDVEIAGRAGLVERTVLRDRQHLGLPRNDRRAGAA